MKHRLSWLVGLATALAVVGANVAPAQAAPVSSVTQETYAAVGDSFAAGWGAGPAPFPPGQSEQAYPVLLAGGTANVAFTAVAMGVTTQTVMGQVAAIPATAKQVTLTVGGNDLGFVPVVTQCVLTPDTCDLTPALQGLKSVRSGLPKVIAAIHQQAPNAKIYVTGYPLLFQATGQTCALGTLGVDPVKVPASVTRQMDGVIVALNLTIWSTTLGSAGKYTKYVDVSGRFLGHGLCGTGDSPNPNTWLNPVVFPQDPVVWLHPTARGQQAYAAAVRKAGFRT